MQSRRLTSVLLLLLTTNVLAAQDRRGADAALTLEEAISLAASNNPTFLRSKNAERLADAQVRTSYGALLPTSGLNFGANYQQGGSNVVQGTEIKGTDTYTTSYSVGLNYGIGLASLVSP